MNLREVFVAETLIRFNDKMSENSETAMKAVSVSISIMGWLRSPSNSKEKEISSYLQVLFPQWVTPFSAAFQYPAETVEALMARAEEFNKNFIINVTSMQGLIEQLEVFIAFGETYHPNGIWFKLKMYRDLLVAYLPNNPAFAGNTKAIISMDKSISDWKDALDTLCIGYMGRTYDMLLGHEQAVIATLVKDAADWFEYQDEANKSEAAKTSDQ